MPLIVICGLPGSGKTRISNAIASHCKDKNIKCIQINEMDLIAEQSARKFIFNDNVAEKHLRSKVKGIVEKSIDKNHFIVVDGCNYIKGFRYELFCRGKTEGTCTCVIYANTNVKTILSWNESKATWLPETVHEISNRFECPSERNRWDKPLFTLSNEDMMRGEYGIENVMQTLQDAKPHVASLATKQRNSVEPNYVHELENVTKKITDAFVVALRTSFAGDRIRVPEATVPIDLRQMVSAVQIKRMHRQYVKLAQRHPCALNEIGNSFVQYINQQLM